MFSVPMIASRSCCIWFHGSLYGKQPAVPVPIMSDVVTAYEITPLLAANGERYKRQISSEDTINSPGVRNNKCWCVCVTVQNEIS